MSKMFKKKNNVADRNTVTSESIKMTPLTIPGAVERGQCIMCVTGITPRRVEGRGEGRAVYANASLVPTVKAVPVFASIPPSTPPTPYARAPPQPITQTKSNDRILGDTGKINRGNLKQPPEKLLSLYDNRAAASGNLRSSIDSEEDEDRSSGSSEYDDSSCEDYPLLDMYLCSLESEAASSVVNNLRNERSEDVDGMDDRKPPATPRLSNERAPPEFSECTKKSSRKGTQKLECPLGMSPEVFYELPIEMQKEVASSRSNGASQSSAGDIDPDVLLSLPEQIRREILEQATQEQPSEDKPRRTSLVSLARLSRSQTSFLSECNIDANDFNNLPEDVKNDIMGEKSRTRGKASELIQESKSQDESVYDPESLANLPEEVRNEVLDDERRQREQQRHKNNAPKSAVGAHRVDIPAGYDPETFSALPEDMQQELRNDATQQRRERGYSADGYDYASIIGARVVPTHPMGSVGTAELCTYEGERNDLGKRHGDGVLKWANGDEYVGKFKDGYIEGRGTISFHDGTFVLVNAPSQNLLLVITSVSMLLQAPNTQVNGRKIDFMGRVPVVSTMAMFIQVTTKVGSGRDWADVISPTETSMLAIGRRYV
jgi:hypothetical protein